MEIGLSVTSAHPRSMPEPTVAQWAIERAGAAREAGFASFSVGDQHAAATFQYLQNVPLMARCLAEIGPMTALPLYLTPLWHPVAIAESVGTLACIAQGPLHCIFGLGAGEAQFAAMGVRVQERASRMEEALPLLRRLMREDSVTHAGKHWRLDNVSINPKPPSPPEFWIGATAAAAIDRAARLGDAWVCGPEGGAAEAVALLQQYRQALAGHGRTEAVRVYPIRRDVYVGESDAEAEGSAGPLVAKGYRGFPREALIIGGAERTIEEMRALGRSGFNHVQIRFLPVGQAKILASIGRIGAEVIPALR